MTFLKISGYIEELNSDYLRSMGNAHAFYLVTTPYHILLALAHIEAASQAATIFLFGRFENSNEYLEALTEAQSLLPQLRVCGRAGWGDRGPTRRMVRAEVARMLDEERPEALIVFNDRNEVAQIALAVVARYGGERTCIEDGSAFYTDWVGPPASRWVSWRKRMLMSRSWQPIQVLGTHTLTQRVLALRPESVRPELEGRVEALDVDLLRSPVLRHFSHEVVRRRVGGEESSIPSCPNLLVLPPLDVDARWASSLLQFLSLMPAVRTAVKYHPREPSRDPVGLLDHGVEIPRYLAVELLYLLWGRTPEVVIGDGRSTPLLTASMFNPDCDVIGLYSGDRPYHADAFEALGIRFQSTA